MPAMGEKGPERDWTFLTNHAHVLLRLAADPDVVLRTVAQQVGITERAAQLIVADLEAAGYITRTRVGRRNHYALDPGRSLRHPLEAHCTVEVLLGIVSPETRTTSTTSTTGSPSAPPPVPGSG